MRRAPPRSAMQLARDMFLTRPGKTGGVSWPKS